MTNYEKMRAMTIEEMAEAIAVMMEFCYGCEDEVPCGDCVLFQLKQEVRE